MAQVEPQQTSAPTNLTPPANDLPAVEPVPTTWPGAFGAYKHSKATVMINLTPLIIVVLINIVTSVIAQPRGNEFNLALSVLSFLLGILLQMVSSYLYLAGVRKQTLSLGDAFKKVDVTSYFKYLGVNIVTGFLMGLSLLLFVIPFFFVMPRLLLAEYFVLDKKLGPIEAVKASWALSAGHLGKLWGIIGAALAMALLFLTIIGIPFAIYFLFMYAAVTIVLYEYLLKQQSAAPVAADPTRTIEA